MCAPAGSARGRATRPVARRAAPARVCCPPPSCCPRAIIRARHHCLGLWCGWAWGRGADSFLGVVYLVAKDLQHSPQWFPSWLRSASPLQRPHGHTVPERPAAANPRLRLLICESCSFQELAGRWRLSTAGRALSRECEAATGHERQGSRWPVVPAPPRRLSKRGIDLSNPWGGGGGADRALGLQTPAELAHAGARRAEANRKQFHSLARAPSRHGAALDLQGRLARHG